MRGKQEPRKPYFERARAISELELSMGPKAVLNFLNLRANDALECWPSETLIGRSIGSSERSVRTYLANLIAAGFVELVRGGGRGLSNRYRLNLPTQNPETVAGFAAAEGVLNPEESAGFAGGGSVVNPATVALNPANSALNPEKVADYPPISPYIPSGGARKKFVKPTPEQVRQFAETSCLPIGEAEPFCDHFESNGWRVGGRGPMRDWRAAFRNWCRRIPEFKRGAAAGPVGSSAAAAAWDSLLAAIRIHSSFEPERVRAAVGDRVFAAARAAGGLKRIESAVANSGEQERLKALFVRAFEGVQT
jgi:hypothetical protein